MNCIWKNVASWKKLYLSKGGRLTLVKITLFSLPTYYYLSFFVAYWLANRLEKVQWVYLWVELGTCLNST